VEEEFRIVKELAPIHHRLMEGRIALGRE